MSEGLTMMLKVLRDLDEAIEGYEDSPHKTSLKETAVTLRNYLNKVMPPLEEKRSRNPEDAWESTNYCCRGE